MKKARNEGIKYSRDSSYIHRTTTTKKRIEVIKLPQE